MLVYETTYALVDGFKRVVPIDVRVGEVEHPEAMPKNHQGKAFWVQLSDGWGDDEDSPGFTAINGYEDYAAQAWRYFHSMLAIGGAMANHITSPSQVIWLDGDGDFVTLTWEDSIRNGWQVAAIGFAYCKPDVHEAITGEIKQEKDL